MRKSVFVLIREAGRLADVAEREDMADACTQARATKREADELRHDASLLESLSNPPETVEELERRLPEGWHYREEDVWFILTNMNGDSMALDVYGKANEIRAAWFAIVGMMEVGR